MTTPAPQPQAVSEEIVCAHLLTQRALELAGKRLLTRAVRGTYTGDLRQLHQHVPVDASQLPRLLAGAFDWMDDPSLAGMVQLDPVRFRRELESYVGGLLTSGTAHDVRYLTAVVTRARRSAA